MRLFKKKCGYCKEKLENSGEVFRNVKDPVFAGTIKKAFCCSEHADAYEQEANKKCGKGCCG